MMNKYKTKEESHDSKPCENPEIQISSKSIMADQQTKHRNTVSGLLYS